MDVLFFFFCFFVKFSKTLLTRVFGKRVQSSSYENQSCINNRTNNKRPDERQKIQCLDHVANDNVTNRTVCISFAYYLIRTSTGCLRRTFESTVVSSRDRSNVMIKPPPLIGSSPPRMNNLFLINFALRLFLVKRLKRDGAKKRYV